MQRKTDSPRRRTTLKKKSRPKMQSTDSTKSAYSQSRNAEIDQRRKEKQGEKRKSRRLMGLLPPAHSKHDEQAKHAEVAEAETEIQNTHEPWPQLEQDREQQDEQLFPDATPSPTSKHPHTLRERLHSLSETWDKARPYIERINGTIVPLHHQGLDREEEERRIEEQRRRSSGGGSAARV